MPEDEFPKLNPEETIIREDKAKHVLHGGQTKQGGTLVLTDQRLLFGRHTSFLFFLFKDTRVDLDVELSQIKKVDTEGMLRKSLVVGYSVNGNYESDVFSVSNVDEWESKLKELVVEN
ncbi:MAG: hypothetical protein BAJATHORv1_10398 [Candidatus Thorarchaeota archaeon]|nr:MAG: hypothetical protein BAJATHORv1_10398 [Candidatus Thorarchaeota archaeon]